MQFEEYQRLAMRTSPEGHDRVRNGCLGLIGESGEIVDAVKKWEFQSGDHAEIPVDKLIDECGDVLWYCAELATGLDESLEELFDRFGAEFYGDLHPLNSAADRLDTICVRLSYACGRPFQSLFEMTASGADENFCIAEAKGQIVGIIVTVLDILENLNATLEDAMERNIAKLRRRYPDGFDPERSLHRTE